MHPSRDITMSCECGKTVGLYRVFRWIDKFNEPLTCEQCKRDIAGPFLLLVLAIFQALVMAVLLNYIPEMQQFFSGLGFELNEFMSFLIPFVLSLIFLLLFTWVYVNLFPATKGHN